MTVGHAAPNPQARHHEQHGRIDNMNALTTALCKKPVIGVAMWLMTLCTTNQALHEQYLDLSRPGTVLTQAFDAPMDETYQLQLVLRPHAESAGGASPDWHSLLCANGATTALSLTLRVSHASGAPAHVQAVEAPCDATSRPSRQTLVLGTLRIQEGRHHIELINPSPLPALAGTRIQVLLTGAGAGFP